MQVINSLLLSKLIYIASIFAVPSCKEVVKEINRIVLRFLWRGQDRVVKMINFYENGGLRVLDFETLVKSLRLSWFKSLYDSENAGWKCYLSHLLKPFRGLFLFHSDYDPSIIHQTACSFLLFHSE